MDEAITGFILAGGKSSRMGTDKASLRLKSGETLLQHAISVVSSVASEARIVGARGDFRDLATVVEDIYPYRGPLGGIHAALLASSTDLNLMLAVDMPAMSADCLQFLREKASAGSAAVTVPKIDGRLQPMCAFYRKSFAAVAEQALLTGRNKIDSTFDPKTTLVVEEEEFTRAGFSSALFRNLNTTADWNHFLEGSDSRG